MYQLMKHNYSELLSNWNPKKIERKIEGEGSFCVEKLKEFRELRERVRERVGRHEGWIVSLQALKWKRAIDIDNVKADQAKARL